MPAFKKDVSSVFKKQIGYHRPDTVLLFIVFFILLFGLVALASASSVSAYNKFGDAYHYFKMQLRGLAVGLIFFWFFSRFDYHKLRNYAFWFLLLSIALLLLVFIPGLRAQYGTSRSWINLFGFSLQPSELVKISFLLYLSAWLETKQQRLGNVVQGIGPFLVVLGIIAFLMILQPDVGTLAIIAGTSLIVYFVGGGELKHIIAVVAFGAVLLTSIIGLNEYQQNRFRCMADPSSDRQGTCYQNMQSLIAVGSGGILGRGLGASRQKFLYLPEIQGDSIFAIIAEEVGLIFSAILVLAYLYLFYRGYKIATRAPDQYGRNLAIGIACWIMLQAMINIGGIIGVMPMTGVPLPLVSYGGTSILATLIGLGILVNISRQHKLKA